MTRRSLAAAILLAAVAAGAVAAPGVASADGSSHIPKDCYKHPITGEILCPYPPPRLPSLAD